MNLAEALYKTPYEKNSILLSYNPLMQLSLCAEYCQKIGKSKREKDVRAKGVPAEV